MTARVRLSARERRLMVAGAVVVGMGLGLGRIAPAWGSWVSAERSRAARSARDLAAAREAVMDRGTLTDTLRARAARYLALAPLLLAGSSVPSAGAALVALVSGTAATAGLEVGAVQVRTDTVPGSVFARVSVRGDARGDVQGVTDFLAAIERGPVLLAVRRIAVSQPDPGAGADRPEALRLEFVVEGLTLDREAVQRLDRSLEPFDSAPVRGSRQ